MRKTIAQGLYLLLTELIAVYLMAWPVWAFQMSSSSTRYVRVATAAAVGAYQTANKAAIANMIAQAIAAPTAASVAIRIATGPVGWTALGVSAALTLAGMYYSASDVQAVKTAALAAQPTTLQVNDAPAPSPVTQFINNCSPLSSGCTQYLRQSIGTDFNTCGARFGHDSSGAPTGWQNLPMEYTGECLNVYQLTYDGTNGSHAAIQSHPSTLPQSGYQAYVQTLPASDPVSIESKTSPVGQGQVAPMGDAVTTLPASPAEVVPTVKKASDVLPTDAVIDPNAPPPTGPQPAVPASQTTTTTTTSTTNPDGSTTKQEEATGSVSCNAGNHEQRSFGSILQDHMTLWGGSGLLGALDLLKTLAWPSTPPTYTLTSSLFGTYTLDFGPWTGMFLAIRSITIALAGFVAYRIIFVGSK